MIESTAFIIGSFEISWAAIIIVAAVFVWFNLACALYKGESYRAAAIWVMTPFSIFFSAFFARVIYWYSHQPQFDGILDALKSKDLFAFSLLGLLPGIVLAALLIRLLRLNRSLPALLDALSPATAAAVSILYLICLFHPSCRGKMIIEKPFLQHLPVSYLNYNTQGEPEYRLATFFLGFLVMLILAIVTLVYYHQHRKTKGSTACFFICFYSAAEFVLESTRYDAGYFPTNGFVSIIQIFSAVCIFGVMIWHTVFRIRKKAWKGVFVLYWVGELLSMGATGFLEYWVQRHGDQAYYLHPLMCISCFAMALFPILMRYKKTKKKASD